MKKLTKNILRLSMFVFALMILISGYVSAYEKGFAGHADYNWATVSKGNKKTDYSVYSAVTWTYSDYSGHRMWFRIIDSSGTEAGRILIQAPLGTYEKFETTAEHDETYYLQAGREHAFNPITYVRGSWEP
ncbi:MAG: hypothetical protein SPI53_04905 [Erysipelotrichaceae bacterium]|nr:hypothetical protein [Erysipelotrichaceae bacterium]